MPKYQKAIIFSKKANLLDYWDGKGRYPYFSGLTSESMRSHYAAEREVELILLIRYEGSRCFCRIKCPINPLPVKGEFEAPGTGPVTHFLRKEGWKQKYSVSSHIFDT